MKKHYSISPDGEKFQLPDPDDRRRKFRGPFHLIGLGLGHIKRIKDQVRVEREEMLLALSAKRTSDGSS